MLLVEGIEVNAADFVRFDVYVNTREYHKVPLGGRKMVGSFVTLKHPGKEGMVLQTSMRVALNELLEDLGDEGDDSVTVRRHIGSGKRTCYNRRLENRVHGRVIRSADS